MVGFQGSQWLRQADNLTNRKRGIVKATKTCNIWHLPVITVQQCWRMTESQVPCPDQMPWELLGVHLAMSHLRRGMTHWICLNQWTKVMKYTQGPFKVWLDLNKWQAYCKCTFKGYYHEKSGRFTTWVGVVNMAAVLFYFNLSFVHLLECTF